MNRKNEFKKIGFQELTWHYIVMYGIVMITIIFYINTFPQSGWDLLVSILVGAFSFLNFIWLYKKPNLYGKFFFLVSLSAMFALLASRCFSNLFPQFSFIIYALILIAVLYANTLHIWDVSTVTFIRLELLSPRTWWGKLLFKFTLLLALIGLPLALTLSHYGKSAISIMFIGIISLFISIGLAFGVKSPSSPWESGSNFIDQQDNKTPITEENLSFLHIKQANIQAKKKKIKK